MVKVSVFSAAVLAVTTVLAHPGEVHTAESKAKEIALTQHYARMASNQYARCANSEATKKVKARSIQRRSAVAEKLRAKRGLQAGNKPFLHRRDLAARADTPGKNKTGIVTIPQSWDAPEDLFSSNASCILTPEVTIGPYWVSGEYVRSDLTEDQDGVPLHLEVELVDPKTCQPLPNIVMDIWSTDALGVYSGVSASGGLNTTYQRGAQISNEQGVVAYDLIFPGHYTGRATHIHTAAFEHAALHTNGTFSGGVTRHIGQIFFDEALRADAETTAPYTTNKQEIMSNADDSIASQEGANGYDPYVEYVYLGDKIEDGVFAWLTVAIDITANYTSETTPAAYWRKGGGYDSDRAGKPPGGGLPPGMFPKGFNFSAIAKGMWPGPKGGKGPGGPPPPPGAMGMGAPLRRRNIDEEE